MESIGLHQTRRTCLECFPLVWCPNQACRISKSHAQVHSCFITTPTHPPKMALTNMTATKIPLFLAPAFAGGNIFSQAAIRSFHASACNQARSRTKRKGNRDSNKQRGVSAIRSTGPRQRLSVDNYYKELPRPREESERPKLEAFEVNENHGLYGFFNKNKDTVLPPDQETYHGRSWTYHDLCFKHFEDLHTLYWQCILELNRVQTRRTEHRRLKLGYGSQEIQRRHQTVSLASLLLRHLPKG